MTTYRISVMQTVQRVAHIEVTARSMTEAVEKAPTLAEEAGEWHADVLEEETVVDSSKALVAA